MNKRIEELAEQAELNATLLFNKDKLEKFAESIIEECITTVLKESKWYWDKNEWGSSDAIQNAAWRIKEHFGHFGDK